MTSEEIALNKCTVDGCDAERVAKLYCGKHYIRWKRHGTPSGAARTPPGTAREHFRRTLNVGGESCYSWPFTKDRRGYGYFTHREKKRYVHREALLLTVGFPPKGKPEAAHKCGNPECYNPEHLYWASRLENERDTIKHKTDRVGEERWNAKLTFAQAEEIRRLNLNQSVLAEMFGVSTATIGRIKRGESYTRPPHSTSRTG